MSELSFSNIVYLLANVLPSYNSVTATTNLQPQEFKLFHGFDSLRRIHKAEVMLVRTAEMPLRCVSVQEERAATATAILRFKQRVKARMVLELKESTDLLLRAADCQTERKWKVPQEVDKAISRLKHSGVSTESRRAEKTLG